MNDEFDFFELPKGEPDEFVQGLMEQYNFNYQEEIDYGDEIMNALMHQGKLCFALNRLPRVSGPGSEPDYQKVEELVDTFITQGFTGFDITGLTPEEVKKVIAEVYARFMFDLVLRVPYETMASGKLCAFVKALISASGAERIEHLIVDGISAETDLSSYDVQMAELKAEGIIDFGGISYEGSDEKLAQILEENFEIDFVRLTVNYLDDTASDESVKCADTAFMHHKPVYADHVLKGGALVNLCDEAKAILKEKDPAATVAGWGLRYAGSNKAVFRVACSMETWDQIMSDTDLFLEFAAIDVDEAEVLDRVAEAIRRNG